MGRRPAPSKLAEAIALSEQVLREAGEGRPNESWYRASQVEKLARAVIELTKGKDLT